TAATAALVTSAASPAAWLGPRGLSLQAPSASVSARHTPSVGAMPEERFTTSLSLSARKAEKRTGRKRRDAQVAFGQWLLPFTPVETKDPTRGKRFAKRSHEKRARACGRPPLTASR